MHAFHFDLHDCMLSTTDNIIPTLAKTSINTQTRSHIVVLNKTYNGKTRLSYISIKKNNRIILFINTYKCSKYHNLVCNVVCKLC